MLDALKTRLAHIADLNAAAAVLEWDQETYMPADAAEVRAAQLTTLRRLSHELFTADTTGDLLDRAAETLDEQGAGLDAALLRVTRRDYERARRLPARLVAELAHAAALAREAWREARETNTFATFAPHLETIVRLNREKADALGYDEHPYDALLDEFEPGTRTAEVARVFAGLREALLPLVRAIAERPAPDDAFLHRRYDPQKQWDFGLAVLRDLGYDFHRGRQDRSAHPFSTTFSVHDVRITTRLDEHFFNTAFFGTLHEAGHALYEQGVDPALDRTPLAGGTSLGMHESQSRLWENLVGRSRPFWQHYFPRLQAVFPENLGDVTLDAFHRAVNRVTPSLIRVEADEVTYNLHIMLRFELELALLEGDLTVRDVPSAWNDRMESYLGLRPDTDADGALQDIHWSLGTLGYFPTYALGNLISAQLFERIRHDLPDLDDQIAAGRFDALLGWLREKIHRHGRARTAPELLQDVTGKALDPAPWLAYVREKYGTLYGL
ncbi:carboxypeptidase M32 [Rhodocaloribacter litoris]|uniref:carboxypeptidase M32 n=1 Tax=Rhodocaloribacter litoris TaxID=2558931 RepID=UPI001420CF79|nr:carboxypeptidase M32 [Rhodocaloribacter litoris]QXD14731.1 carboxypeptidase M32 [Rhodocaloribacter litoris]